MVATSAGLAPLRRSGLTLLSSRVGLNAFSHEMGDFPPNLLLRPGRFRIEMVFLNAQLFRRCLIIAEQLNVLVMGSATSTPSSRRGQWRQWRRTKHRQSTSFLLQLLKACARSSTTVNLTQIATSNAESNLFWALVYVPQGTTAGALNIATAGATPGSMYEPNQFVMNCGVVDPSAGPIRMSSPISRNLNDGDKITLLIRPTLDGAATTVSLVVRYAITLN